jgi:DGQHR domain-containing protein
MDGLVSGESAKKVYGLRSKAVDEKTVSATNPDSLATKVQGEEQDGWTVAKRNKKSVRLAKPKPMDRQLEDDVWCLLYRFGFKELNADRNFTIRVGEQAPPRQIDIFAKDDETVFIVECTHSQEKGGKSTKALIDKINGLREEVIKAIHSHYGRNPKLKVKWAIATRDVDWRKADADRAKDANIAVITEQDIAYYGKLTAYLKEAARYQFLARYLHGEGVDGLATEIPATKGSMGGVTFYNFLISPFDLLKIAYISHRALAANDIDTYQRMVKPSRLKNIAAYIDDGGQFPTNIVINFKTKRSLRFSKIQSFDNTTFGTLRLPGQYGSAWVIDGQHRLYGFAFSKRLGNQVVPVLAYENLPTSEEMRLFVDINCEQVKVPRSLLNEIYSNLNYGSEDPTERLEAQYPRIALRLDELRTSPIRDRVVTVSKDKDNFRCLTLTSLSDGIRENRFLGTVSPILEPGPLSHLSNDTELTTEKAADVLAAYLKLFADGVPGNWQLGDAKGGFLCTNNGIRALLRLMKELVIFIEHRDHVKAVAMEAADIVEKIAPLVNPVIKYFENADATEIQSYRSNQALAGVAKNCLGMMGTIAEAFPGFTNKELEVYLGSRDREGTSVARRLIDEINVAIFNDVLRTLRSHFGEAKDAWWWQGVPQATREKCDSQVNRDNGIKERWQYLSLADYQTIVPHNWELFKDRYDFGDKGKKGDKVSWIGRVNRIRQTTHHPEKGLISKQEVAAVREIHAKVAAMIGIGSPLA